MMGVENWIPQMNTTLPRTFQPTPLPPPPPAPKPHHPPRTVAAVVLATAVALAFADASVVALALPDLYLEFETTIPAVSWVLISYALAVAVAGLIGLTLVHRIRAAVLTIAGAVVFAASSLAAGLAPSLSTLIAARVVQGVGAAALLAGALGALGALLGDQRRAASWWAAAGVAGAALGPALGGAVTQLLDWRAVFLVQAPVAALAAIATVSVRRQAPSLEVGHTRRPRGAMLADTALGLTFGALVGALFLGVLMLVVVWGLPPLEGAFVVSALPVGTLIAHRVAASLPRRGAVLAGAVALAGGLITLAYLPDISTTWVAGAMGLCGVGFGALVTPLGALALPVGGGVRAATLTSTARHLGLVVGLAIIAPVLSQQVMSAAETAPLAATQVMLDSPVGGVTKVRIALDIRDEIDKASDGEVPDLSAAFAENGAHDDAEVAQMQHDVEYSVQSVVTRAFRSSFVIAALFAAFAGLVGLLAFAVTRDVGTQHHPGGAAAAIAIALAALMLPIVAVGTVDASFGVPQLVEPCTAPPDPYPGDGLDAALQRFVLSGLNGAACELGVSREELVLSLEPRSGVDIEWDRDTIAQALKSGVSRAIDDADERDTIPGWLATALRWTVDRLPASWFLEQLGVE